MKEKRDLTCRKVYFAPKINWVIMIFRFYMIWV